MSTNTRPAFYNDADFKRRHVQNLLDRDGFAIGYVGGETVQIQQERDDRRFTVVRLPYRHNLSPTPAVADLEIIECVHAGGVQCTNLREVTARMVLHATDPDGRAWEIHVRCAAGSFIGTLWPGAENIDEEDDR